MCELEKEIKKEIQRIEGENGYSYYDQDGRWNRGRIAGLEFVLKKIEEGKR